MKTIFKNKVVELDEENLSDLLLYSWCFDSNNYLSNRSNVINDRFHRYIMRDKIEKFMIEHNLTKSQVKIDHINGDVLDNRKENLRCVCHSDNLMNRSKQKNNTSGYKGISIAHPHNVDYFNVGIQYKKKSYRKVFCNLEDAINWRNEKIKELKINEERNK